MIQNDCKGKTPLFPISLLPAPFPMSLIRIPTRTAANESKVLQRREKKIKNSPETNITTPHLLEKLIQKQMVEVEGDASSEGPRLLHVIGKLEEAYALAISEFCRNWQSFETTFIVNKLAFFS